MVVAEGKGRTTGNGMRQITSTAEDGLAFKVKDTKRIHRYMQQHRCCGLPVAATKIPPDSRDPLTTPKDADR